MENGEFVHHLFHPGINSLLKGACTVSCLLRVMDVYSGCCLMQLVSCFLARRCRLQSHLHDFMRSSVQQTKKGNAAVQGMHLVAGQRCTPFAESFRGLTATSYRTAQRASLTLEPFTMLHVRPLQNSKDTVEDGLARLFERSVDDSQQPGCHQTLILELPKVPCSFSCHTAYSDYHSPGSRPEASLQFFSEAGIARR
jgi:hypothetical protein